MNLLVLGGGGFVGYAVAQEGVRRGWSVLCLSRGLEPVPTGCAQVVADRNDDGQVTGALGSVHPDMVVDTWIGAPRAVTTAARILASCRCAYGYVSSRSVYEPPGPGEDPTRPTPLVDATADTTDTDYAVRKRGGELAALRALGPERVALFRPGLIFGPRENSGRLGWWLRRLARGGPTLAPGPGDQPVQVLDVRDLARFVLDVLAAGRGGCYDLAPPPGHATMERLLVGAVEATGGAAELIWADGEWLVSEGVVPFRDLPIWAPAGTPEHYLHHGRCSPKAAAAGLRCCPVERTVADTWRHIVEHDSAAMPSRVGLDPGRESGLLRRWQERAGNES